MRTGSCIIILCAMLAGCATQPADDEFAPIAIQSGLADGFYTVRRVVDGDTIVLDNVGYLRFVRFNAPEMDEPGGREMSDRLKEMVEGELVYVAFTRRMADAQPVRGT